MNKISNDTNVNAYYAAAKKKKEGRFISNKPWIGKKLTGQDKDGKTFYFYLDKDMKVVYVDKDGNLNDER